MDIAAFRGQDTKAWPGKIALVVVAGKGPHKMRDVEAELHKSFTTKAVVFEGDVESQSDLPIVAKKLKLKGKLIRVNTDGSNPGLLKKMVGRRVVDYISVTIKGPLYEGSENVRESVRLLQSSNADHEVVLDWGGDAAEAREAASQITGTFVLYSPDMGFEGLRAVAGGLEGPRHVRVRNRGGEQSIT